MKTATEAVHGLEVERRQRRLHSEQDLDGSDALGTNGLETSDSNVRNLTQPTGARAAEAHPRERSPSYRAELEPADAATRLKAERLHGGTASEQPVDSRAPSAELQRPRLAKRYAKQCDSRNEVCEKCE